MLHLLRQHVAGALACGRGRARNAPAAAAVAARPHPRETVRTPGVPRERKHYRRGGLWRLSARTGCRFSSRRKPGSSASSSGVHGSGTPSPYASAMYVSRVIGTPFFTIQSTRGLKSTADPYRRSRGPRFTSNSQANTGGVVAACRGVRALFSMCQLAVECRPSNQGGNDAG